MFDQQRALTVKRPWAGAILLGGKDVENRTWPPPAKYVGHRIFIHVGLKHDIPGRIVVAALSPGLVDELPAGYLCGTVLITGFTTESRSPWASPGQFHWQLAEPKLLSRPLKARGSLGLWRPTPVELSGM